MLQSILYQILLEEERLYEYFLPLLKQHYDLEWSYEHIKERMRCLHKISFDLLLYIAVDAVDESDDDDQRHDALNFLAELLHQQSRCTIKILIASRPERYLLPWMSQARRVVLERKNSNDIKLVVAAKVLELEQLRASMSDLTVSSHACGSASLEVFLSMKEYVLENAHGVFLWVKLVLQELELCIKAGGYSLNDLDQAVRSLPRDLVGKGGFYWHMTQRLFKRQEARTARLIVPSKGGPDRTPQEQSRRLFALVAFAERPLELDELRDALATSIYLEDKKNLSTFDISRHRLLNFDRRELYSLSGGLLEVAVSAPVVDSR